MSYIEIRRTKGDIIAIYPEANFKPNGEYQHRTATEEGYRQFYDYFKNVMFCCDQFEISCEEEGYTDCKVFIEYHRQTRSFWVENGHNLISHCPYCGKKFPKELGLEWIHLVEAEFGQVDCRNIQSLQHSIGYAGQQNFRLYFARLCDFLRYSQSVV